MPDKHEYPALLVEIPHQRKARVYIATDEIRLKEICEASVGNAYEWPGHWENEGTDLEEWIDTRTLDDYLRAFAHDLHAGFALWGKAEALEYLAGKSHQAIYHQRARVLAEVTRAAREVGWID